MSDLVKKCKKCNHIGIYSEDYNVHKNCNGELEVVNISCDDLNIISRIANDNNFLQAMIDLKEKDPIEYQLKMSQFKTQVQQQKSSKVQNDNRPKCPTCGSTNVEKISATKKAFGGAMFGLFSSDVRNTMHCKKCGAKW